MDRRLLLPLTLVLATGTAASAQKLVLPVIEPAEVEAASSSASGIILPNLLLQVFFAAHLERDAHDDPDALAIERRIFERLTAPPEQEQPAAATNSALLGSTPEEALVVIHCLRDLAIEALLAGTWDFEEDRGLGKGFDLWLDVELAAMQAECRASGAPSPRG